MSPTATAILAYFLAHGAPGTAPRSLEVLPECGSNRQSPECATPGTWWSNDRKAWVRLEPRDVAAARLTTMAEAITDAAQDLIEGRPYAPRVEWSGSKRELAFKIATNVFWEGGAYRDVQEGAPPMGRGPSGEACGAQLTLTMLRRGAAVWLPAAARKTMPREELAREVLGLDYQSQLRCYLAAGWLIAQLEPAAQWKCHAGDRTDPLFALYIDGKCTATTPLRAAIVRKRSRTYWRLVQNPPALPDWFEVADEPVARGS